ncbi:MAG: glycosyl transferase family 1, partial [Candidatus Omnitrophica bacterium]|nr:glycosyl transferase family 1 [Candidatus Omnitrophota bacterium]
SHAYMAVETTEASGTHPAILDAMGLRNCVLVNGTAANLEVIGACGFSYDGEEKDRGLLKKMEFLINNPGIVDACKSKAAEHVKKNYSWDKAADLYEKLYRGN